MSKRTIIITVLGVVALIGAVALGAMALSGDEAQPTPSAFTASDDGSAVSVRVGETFTVVLEGNPTTGYSWQVGAVDQAVLTSGEPGYVAESDLIGAGGTYTFTFTAVAAGETQVRLVYLRPWETVAPLQTFTLDVTVH
jgi:inhibitor of cysteine peptidase